MKKEVLLSELEDGNVACTTAVNFINKFEWEQENINPDDYMVEINVNFSFGGYTITFIKNIEFDASIYDNPIIENIYEDDLDEFIDLLTQNSNIFFKKY